MHFFYTGNGIGLIDEDDARVDLVAVNGTADENGHALDFGNAKAEVVEVYDFHAIDVVFL